MADITGNLQSAYRNALASTRYEQFNSRGFIPFQFSSRRHQMDVSSSRGIPGVKIPNISGLSSGGSGSGLSINNDKQAWYEMWINPQKIELSREFIYKKEHTAGAIVSYHYRPEMIKMSVSGVCGWIAINPQKEKENSPLGFSGANSADKLAKIFPSNQTIQSLANISNNNSPRIFLKRLRTLAEEPMYYVDSDGIEHFNPKYIKIYTKQYPDGVVCEGYYTSFKVPEDGEDPQTVQYSFEYLVERLVPIEDLKSMNGMFNSINAFGKSISSSLGSIL